MSEKSGPGAPKPRMPMMSRHNLPPSKAAEQKRAKSTEDLPAEEAMSPEEFDDWAAENPDEAKALEEITIGMAKGEITPAEAYGISVQELAEAAVLGAEAIEAGNLDSAVIVFEGLVTADPNVPSFRTSLGQCYEKLGYEQEALDSYGAALDLYAMIDGVPVDEVADAVVLRSMLLLKQGREEEALQELEDFVPPDLDPSTASPPLVQAYAMLLNLLEKAAAQEEADNAEDTQASPATPAAGAQKPV
jgi:tetratricopeptide (TPR) repeat protein